MRPIDQVHIAADAMQKIMLDKARKREGKMGWLGQNRLKLCLTVAVAGGVRTIAGAFFAPLARPKRDHTFQNGAPVVEGGRSLSAAAAARRHRNVEFRRKHGGRQGD